MRSLLEKLFKSHLQTIKVLNKMFDSNDKKSFKKGIAAEYFWHNK
jgi:hypothetical protein